MPIETRIIKLNNDLSTQETVFGLTAEDRLMLQARKIGSKLEDVFLYAGGGVVLGNASLNWLIDNPDRMLVSADGNAFAVVTQKDLNAEDLPPVIEEICAEQGFELINAGSAPDVFTRKLRRRQSLLVKRLDQDNVPDVQWQVFKEVYKGITDIVTRYVWPVPAFYCVRFCTRFRITPNMVTYVGILLVIWASIMFYQGNMAAGLLAGWVATFLDTVDGKLARVSFKWSKFGNALDHGTDIIHPPIWWLCVAFGLITLGYDQVGIYISLALILGTYFLSRYSETRFKSEHGFNQFLWRRFDTALRFVITRRNIILLMISVGWLFGRADLGFHAAAIWSVLTSALQMFSTLSATRQAAKGQEITPWLVG